MSIVSDLFNSRIVGFCPREGWRWVMRRSTDPQTEINAKGEKRKWETNARRDKANWRQRQRKTKANRRKRQKKTQTNGSQSQKVGRCVTDVLCTKMPIA
jgi:hypothetical protein